MVYYAIMECSKRGFLYCISFSLFFTVTLAASSAAPGQSGFPPFPPDQELQEEGFPEPPAEPPVDAPAKPLAEPPAESPETFPENMQPLPPKDSEHIFYYRGNRAYSENLPLEIYQINCQRLDENKVIIELVFNQSINPRSINQNSLLIDNNTLPDGIRFSFNKKGDRIKIEVSLSGDTFDLKIQNVRAFDGTLIEPVEMIAQIDQDDQAEETLIEKEN